MRHMMNIRKRGLSEVLAYFIGNDWNRDDVNPINDSPSYGDLYRGMW